MPRRILQGQVVSDKNDKTVIVSVESRVKHPVYKKYVRRSRKYAAHDSENVCRSGDYVKIIEVAPVSKRKRWSVLTSNPEMGEKK